MKGGRVQQGAGDDGGYNFKYGGLYGPSWEEEIWARIPGKWQSFPGGYLEEVEAARAKALRK